LFVAVNVSTNNAIVTIPLMLYFKESFISTEQ
jgi:hypothetical protein